MNTKIRFEKTQTSESENSKQIKLSFSGLHGGAECQFSIKGDEEDIRIFMDEHKIKRYGQMLELDVENNQQTLE